MRPCLVIVEPEPSEALSARKLVVETAKFNVITAYSGQEALGTLQKYPDADGVIVHSDLDDVGAEEVIRAAKEQNPMRTTVLLRSSEYKSLPNADYHVSSHEPGELVELLRELYGDPRGSDSRQQ
jgi:response regulator RpfG family c-di-GMP phosphodiesterase